MALSIGALKAELENMPNDSDIVIIQVDGEQYHIMTLLSGDDNELILSADIEEDEE